MPDQSPPDRGQILADAARMEAIAGGDTRSFEAVVRAESARLCGLAASLLSSRAEAEEILQEALLRLWQQAPNWEPKARIATWLHTVVYRLSIDRLRQRRPSVEVGEIEDTVPGGEASPEDIAWDNQREALLERALAGLSPRQRAAILLAHRHGLAQAEAAAVLKLSEDAYESLLARGRRQLKKTVAGMTGEAGGE